LRSFPRGTIIMGMKTIADKVLAGTACIGLGLLLAACPLTLEHGLPAGDFDVRLLGTWRSEDDPHGLIEVEVKRLDDLRYAIRIDDFDPESYGSDCLEYSAYLSDVDGRTYLVASPVGEDEPFFIHFQLDFIETGLSLAEVRDSFNEDAQRLIESDQDVLAFFRKYQETEGFISYTGTWRKP